MSAVVTDTTEQDLINEVAALLREYLRTNRTRTDLLKVMAPLIVEMRRRHTLEDGRTDWSGRSPAYRAAIGQVYALAKVPPEHMVTVQAAIRYHVGNVLRQTAERDELEGAGMSAASPRERLDRQRAFLNALAAAQSSTGAPTGDAARLATYAEALLENVDVSDETLAATEPARREAACISLHNAAAHIDSLIAAIEAFEARQS